ncbi:hypothetical protein DBO85_09585 [Pseudomonas mangrovi]|uniref:Uncharacterized protein n=1 Tax=Pseudomonas mangrovi TaxID=2161748 RepID=A0A2T5P9D2_9PSED|nr:hypothetical protein DBO85_09585 [Pseudomonas mangrovi]
MRDAATARRLALAVGWMALYPSTRQSPLDEQGVIHPTDGKALHAEASLTRLRHPLPKEREKRSPASPHTEPSLPQLSFSLREKVARSAG